MNSMNPLVVLLCLEKNSMQLVKNALLEKSSKFIFLTVENKEELLEKSKWMPIDLIIFDDPMSEKCGKLFIKNFKYHQACIPLFLYSKNKASLIQPFNELKKIVDDYFFGDESDYFYDKAISALVKYSQPRIERIKKIRKFQNQRLLMEKIFTKLKNKKASILKSQFLSQKMFLQIDPSILN